MTPIAILPGWGFSSHIFAPFVSRFKNFDPVFLEFPTLKNPAFKEYQNDFENQIPERATLMAWSFGGLAAIDFCHRFPHKISKLILISSSPQFLTEGDWCGVALDKIQAFQQAIEENQTAALQEFIQWVHYPSRKSHVLSALQNNLRQDDFLAPELSFFSALNLQTEYLGLKIPTLHLVGDCDPLLNSKSLSVLAKLNPAIALKIIPGAGHAPFLTHEKETQLAIEEFLSST